MYYTHCRE
jgi:chaperone required for assembly of F1-ATPase